MSHGMNGQGNVMSEVESNGLSIAALHLGEVMCLLNGVINTGGIGRQLVSDRIGESDKVRRLSPQLMQ